MQGGPTPKELEDLARKLEAFLTKMNARFLQEARINPERLVGVFVETQGAMLHFDASAQRRFEEAIEEARIKTLSRDSFLISCLLTSAIALKQFKREPRSASLTGVKARLAGVLKARSTGTAALWAFTVASFYAVVGSAAYKRIVELKEKKGGVVKITTKAP